MPLKIRPERKEDLNEIYQLIQTAFKTAKVKDGNEQDYAVKLRNGENYIPELALVVDNNNTLIGHIMLTKTYIENIKLDVLLLAPISVLLEYRNKGIGEMLIKKSFELAKAMGYKAVFLMGDSAYYSRFGFTPISNYHIKQSSNIPDKYVEYILACELEKDILKNIQGTLIIPE